MQSHSLQRARFSRPIAYLAVAAWMGVIFWFSAQSSLPDLTPSAPDLQSIAGHLFVYAVLAWLVAHALRLSGVRHAALWALLFAICYGISDEFHQSFVPNRTPDPFDLAMDTLGAGASLLLWTWWRARRGG